MNKPVYFKPAAEEVTELLQYSILQDSDPAGRNDYGDGGEYYF